MVTVTNSDKQTINGVVNVNLDFVDKNRKMSDKFCNVNIVLHVLETVQPSLILGQDFIK